MKRIMLYAWLVIVLIFMYLPILLLAVYSFTDAKNMGIIGAFSLDNYKMLLVTPELRNMIIGTFILAFGSALIATIIGTCGAIGAFYSKKHTRGILNTINQIPVVNADVVTGFSICIFLIIVLRMSKDTFIPLVCGHAVLSVPFVYLSVIPKLKQMDNSIYEAALDMGAHPHTALFRIVLPQIMQGIFSGFVMAVTLSLDDYFIATYMKPATFDTISTYVVNATKGAQTDIKTALWALSTVIFVLVVLAVLLMNINVGKNTEKEEDNA